MSRRAIYSIGLVWLLSLSVGCSSEPAPPARVPNPVAISSEARVVLDSEGWTLEGVWRQPSAPEPMPAVLLLHSAASSKDESAGIASDLSARGIASLRLDLRAHGESVNLGRFREPYAAHRSLLEGTHEDIIVALNWMTANQQVASDRVGVVAASYSGEAVAKALRSGAPQITACVVLSPGSFSEASTARVDESDTRWLFIHTSEESEASLQFIDEVFERLANEASSAEVHIVPGAGHAGEILRAHPVVAHSIVNWLVSQLGVDENR